MAACLHASKALFRFVLLALNCLLSFGSYFCFDMPSVLQTRFQCNSSSFDLNTTTNFTNDCLDMSPAQYNLLYMIYAWTNAVIVIGAGFFIDKVGNQVGALTFSFLCVLGSSLFALGTHLRGTAALLPVMLLGRLLFGAGNGSLTIVQTRLSAFWFKDKELAMAFGVTLAFSRLGSVLNFLVTVSFADRFGLSWTLWGGAMLCCLGLVAAILVGILDRIGLKQLGVEETSNQNAKKLKFTDIKHFNLLYWLIALSIMFFYNGVFPFVADASKFIQDKYGYSQKDASYVSGAVYYLSMVLSPFLGYVVDIIGKRGVLTFACAILTTPVFILLAVTDLFPIILTLWLGLTYSLAAASMWPSIPLVVMQSAVGTAMGLVTSIQMIGIGLSNIIVGAILETKDQNKEEILLRWKYVMIFLLANNVLCILVSVALNVVDRARDKVLNLSRSQKRQLIASSDDSFDSRIGRSPSTDDDIRGNDVIIENGDREANENDPLLG
ncbi:hypothetical protein HELRODRAFT_193538 [Helobdella robusta]|uniref:Lysosomal dipeptide transporter MFSD1 n=1 Tax=Helobdella robusta TaxID=6412 RepID=T1FV37_HELRO|nr:hypothetical protein HELRODRAFT_193538 [Helobdella robusta]ESN95555.1 hypothetical protein HELRODRAFT_193538 [Helobdella robusta]